jgi:hypothetical protein
MRQQFTTKACKMPVGAHGLFYLSGRKSFTVPFIVASSPDTKHEGDFVWTGRYFLSFNIYPLGTAPPYITRRDLEENLPTLSDSQKRWDQKICFRPNQAFVASELSPRDWEALVRLLGRPVTSPPGGKS